MNPHRIGLVLTAAAALAAPAPCQTTAPLLEQARAAYNARADTVAAKQAVELFERTAAEDPGSYAARWEGARAIYFLGTYPMENASDKEKMALFDRGILLARAAIALEPEAVEGHFWLGVLLGVYGEAKGIFKSLALVPDIRTEMETCLRLDPSVSGWGPDRVLGRMLFKLPWFKGGDKKESRAHLEKSLAGSPNDALTKLYLAETLKSLGEKPAAIRQLEEIVAMTPEPNLAAEYPYVARQARELLAKLR
jgi:tetratricopeptide (TPR) repeat protein